MIATSPVTCLLFGAGRGRRMRPLSDSIPKPALPVLDVPLGAFGLLSLLDLDARIVVNASHLVEVLDHRLVRPYQDRVELFVEEPAPLGTAGTLKALPEIGDRVLTYNSDLVTDLSPSTLLETHSASGAGCTLACVAASAADLEISGDRATRFIDRRKETMPGVRFAGMAVFESGTLDRIPDKVPAGLGETLLPDLVLAGEVAIHLHDGYMLDVGSPVELLSVSLQVLNKRIRAPASPPGEMVPVPGGVAYVGPGAVFAEDSLGPGAILLHGSRVAKGARLERSVLWEGAYLDVDVMDGLWAGGRDLLATPDG